MSVPIGFKRLTIRIKDGKTAVPDKTQFVIEGKKRMVVWFPLKYQD